MTRVAVICASMPPAPSPEADYVMHLCARLAAAGCEVDVLTSRGNVPRGLPANVRVRDSMGGWGWSHLPTLAGWLRRVRPDGVLLAYIGWIYQHHPMVTFAPTLARYVVPRAAFVTLFPNVLGAHPGPSRKAWVAWRLAAMLSGGADPAFGTLLRHSSRTIVFSEHHRNVLEQVDGAAAKRSLLIPPPPILHRCPADAATRNATRARLGIAAGERLIGYFGYIYPGKGVETLIDAFSLVAGRRPDCKLFLVGRLVDTPDADGTTYSARIRERVARCGFAERVLFAGDYDAASDDGSRYLGAMDVCVLPLDSGVQLNNSSFAAAAAHGLPIVTTRHPALEAPFVDRVNVLLCQPKDPRAMAAAVDSLLDDAELRRRLARGAAAMAETWFDWRRTIERTLSALFDGQGSGFRDTPDAVRGSLAAS